MQQEPFLPEEIYNEVTKILGTVTFIATSDTFFGPPDIGHERRNCLFLLQEMPVSQHFVVGLEKKMPDLPSLIMSRSGSKSETTPPKPTSGETEHRGCLSLHSTITSKCYGVPGDKFCI